MLVPLGPSLGHHTDLPDLDGNQLEDPTPKRLLIGLLVVGHCAFLPLIDGAIRRLYDGDAVVAPLSSG